MKKTGNLLFLLYLAAVLRITVFRSDFGTHPLFADGQVNLTFLEGYLALIRGGHWWLFFYLFIGNIIWFVPFGAYLKYARKTPSFFSILFCGFLFSLLIESLQFVFGTGYSELDDLFLNTLGTGIGAAVPVRIRRRQV